MKNHNNSVTKNNETDNHGTQNMHNDELIDSIPEGIDGIVSFKNSLIDNMKCAIVSKQVEHDIGSFIKMVDILDKIAIPDKTKKQIISDLSVESEAMFNRISADFIKLIQQYQVYCVDEFIKINQQIKILTTKIQNDNLEKLYKYNHETLYNISNVDIGNLYDISNVGIDNKDVTEVRLNKVRLINATLKATEGNQEYKDINTQLKETKNKIIEKIITNVNDRLSIVSSDYTNKKKNNRDDKPEINNPMIYNLNLALDRWVLLKECSIDPGKLDYILYKIEKQLLEYKEQTHEQSGKLTHSKLLAKLRKYKRIYENGLSDQEKLEKTINNVKTDINEIRLEANDQSLDRNIKTFDGINNALDSNIKTFDGINNALDMINNKEEIMKIMKDPANFKIVWNEEIKNIMKKKNEDAKILKFSKELDIFIEKYAPKGQIRQQSKKLPPKLKLDAKKIFMEPVKKQELAPKSSSHNDLRGTNISLATGGNNATNVSNLTKQQKKYTSTGNIDDSDADREKGEEKSNWFVRTLNRLNCFIDRSESKGKDKGPGPVFSKF